MKLEIEVIKNITRKIFRDAIMHSVTIVDTIRHYAQTRVKVMAIAMTKAAPPHPRMHPHEAVAAVAHLIGLTQDHQILDQITQRTLKTLMSPALRQVDAAERLQMRQVSTNALSQHPSTSRRSN